MVKTRSLVNQVLMKTFLYENDPDDCTGELVFGEARGEEIHWKEGPDLASVIVNREDRKHISEGPAEKPSFFVFFQTVTSSVDEITSENDGDDDDSEDEGEEHKDKEEGDSGDEDEDDDDGDDPKIAQLKVHFSIGEELKDRVIFCAVHWYTGEARVYEEYDWLSD
ncbi:nucleosome assembly protein [Halenospora varia]|nr:nucleosome assembly protein [Halenospora varia]